MPSKQLKALQAWILRNILDKLSTSEASVGFELGESIRNNAAPHIGSNAMLCLDLVDFFLHIKSLHVFNIFKQLGYNNLISTVFTNICTLDGSLPQGSPCSPKLANLYCISLDKRIQGFVGRRGIVYTRYADDITLSGPDDAIFPKIYGTIIKIIESENLKVNPNKTRFAGFRRKKVTTGLIVAEDRVGIGRAKYRILRAKIHKLALCKALDINEHSAEVNHVSGWLSYLNSVDQMRLKQIRSYVDKLKSKYPESILSVITIKT